MGIKIGDTLPDIELKTQDTDGIHAVKTGEIFAHKKVVLFAVPGAFTPT
ncbi:MAG: redoxin family protein, partial [Pseudomonadales bacterium]|nr:redoxin family protein [Pseudomonadales bacterium]